MVLGVVGVGAVLMAGACGSKAAADKPSRQSKPKRITVAQFDKAPCTIFTGAELAKAAAKEYAKWDLKPKGKPFAGKSSCMYPVSGNIGGGSGDIQIRYMGKKETALLNSCKEGKGDPYHRDRMVKVGDEACVDGLSYLYFRVGDECFVVMPDIAERGNSLPSEVFQSLSVAAGKYAISRLSVPSTR